MREQRWREYPGYRRLIDALPFQGRLAGPCAESAYAGALIESSATHDASLNGVFPQATNGSKPVQDGEPRIRAPKPLPFSWLFRSGPPWTAVPPRRGSRIVHTGK